MQGVNNLTFYSVDSVKFLSSTILRVAQIFFMITSDNISVFFSPEALY